MEATEKKALTYVYRILRMRLWSEHEIRNKLQLRQYDTTSIETVIAHLKEHRFIDDQVFAKCWIQSRLKKPFGERRIRRELFLKGIDKKIIEDEWTTATEHISEDTIVLDLAQRRAQKYGDLDPYKIKQRVYGYLLRRGFTSTSSRRAISAL